MIPRHVPRRRLAQRGVTLVELMISLVLGLLVTAAIYQIFLSNQQTYRMQRSLAQIQENGRFALEILARDIRQVGYRGVSLSEDMSGCLAEFSSNGGIGDWQADPEVPNLPGHMAGTDVLLFSQVGSMPGVIITKAAGASVHYSSEGNLGVKVGDTVMISDGNGCDVFEVDGFNNNNIQAVSKGGGFNWSSDYANGGRLLKVEEKAVYFIGLNEAEAPALRRLDLKSSRGVETLADGVEDMQITYGVGTDKVEAYVNRPDDWDRVVAVRVSLRLSGEEGNVMSEPVTLKMGNIDFTAQESDRRMHQVFTTTIALRNRLP